MVRRAGDQVSTAPIGVVDQSMERISAPISPPPARQSWFSPRGCIGGIQPPACSSRSHDGEIRERCHSTRTSTGGPRISGERDVSVSAAAVRVGLAATAAGRIDCGEGGARIECRHGQEKSEACLRLFRFVDTLQH